MKTNIRSVKSGICQIILFVSFLSINLFAQNSSFIFKTDRQPPDKNYTPTYIGNGFISLSSTELGSDGAESFMAGLFDEAPEDIARIAALPNWNEIDLFTGSSWLSEENKNFEHISAFTQQINMFNGELKTSYTYNNNSKPVDIKITSIVSRAEKNIAVIKFSITPHFKGVVKINFPVKERKEPERFALAKLTKISSWPESEWPPIWYPGFVKVNHTEVNAKEKTISVSGSPVGRTSVVNIFAKVDWQKTIPGLKIAGDHSSKEASLTFTFPAENGKSYTFYKYVYIDKKEKAENRQQPDKGSNFLKKTSAKSYAKIVKQSEARWSELWKTDIITEGNPEFQKMVHSMMYYLLSSIYKNSDFSIPPMGLATAGYYGHVFWDADTYMFSPLLLMHPEMAKSVVMFRYNALNSAKENAEKNHYKGAMYPWESDEIGKEATPFFAYQNALKENHIVGDVAIAQWQYYLATNDKKWLRDYGSKVISETANFWASRVKYDKEKDRYEIGNVVSVSEGLTNVSNETYTNSVAKLNLEIAEKVNNILKLKSDPVLENIGRKMFIPFNKEKGFHPTFGNAAAGEGATELWSSVTPLLTFPLQIEMSEKVKENNLYHAVQNLQKDGAGADMGINFLPIIAAEVGNDSLFNLVINKTVKGFLRPPFNVITETQTNYNYNFITGAGAFLQQVIFGYTGLRITDKGLEAKYKPMLPEGISKLVLKNFKFRNKVYDFIVQNGKLNRIKK